MVQGASDGRKFVEIEPDARHVELILKSFGLLKPSKAVSTPGTRHTDDQVERRKGEAQLSPTMTTVFRSCDASKNSLTRLCADLGGGGGEEAC